MEGQIPEPVKAQRSDELLEMDRQKSIAFRRQKLGSVAEVLFEEEKTILGKRYFLGHTEDYVRVAVADKPRGEAGKRGELVPVELMDFLTEDILLGNETDLF